MYDPTTSSSTHSATSSPESVSGPTLCGLPDGPTTAPSGLALAPVNPSALLRSHGSEKASMTTGTCGPSGSILSASACLSECLGNRLEAKMESLGSTLYSITWKAKTTPARRGLSVQLVRALTTSGNAFTSLPTPCARDGRDIGRSNAFLSQRKRHSPSLATRLLDLGLPWQVITPIYCLAMNLSLQWNACAPTVTETQLMRRLPALSSKPRAKRSTSTTSFDDGSDLL
ncbi:hypothetical protein B0G83_10458 [Paraburkholderia sp. BL21I4N1]|nr:hypothetical protein B0G83_10458 [Paraburkholderia sp. BL21I4N1]